MEVLLWIEIKIKCSMDNWWYFIFKSILYCFKDCCSNCQIIPDLLNWVEYFPAPTLHCPDLTYIISVCVQTWAESYGVLLPCILHCSTAACSAWGNESFPEAEKLLYKNRYRQLTITCINETFNAKFVYFNFGNSVVLQLPNNISQFQELVFIIVSLSSCCFVVDDFCIKFWKTILEACCIN